MGLYEQFTRQYDITGSNSTVKQNERFLKKYFFPYLEEKFKLKDITKLNQNMLNSFYHHILKLVRKGEMKKSSGKKCLYAVKKFIRVFNRMHRTDLTEYNVPAFLATVEGKKNIKVTEEEYKNIKKWRELNNGKVPSPDEINK
ncbi:hypothetical protein DEFDS_0713 [Deferribacter desulfuricans SSM1]|uniref:Integrase SAM-like N-terminal domain-containing protein n=1 Tax=Deferribacter desulfuricans (strain DSM 14783 / JCM 11476 / NBRC 101012 / SSM1) TaxID=639282 RepID=D3PC70_DEFDS|nr:hypothetical protein [Deferribacter desulfuricans]BAI80193.1 hypothetical protein DEFDS_0713 [Deferribacter desulfuricans SSM1]